MFTRKNKKRVYDPSTYTCKPHAPQSHKEDSEALEHGFFNFLVGKNPHIPWLLFLDSLKTVYYGKFQTVS